MFALPLILVFVTAAPVLILGVVALIGLAVEKSIAGSIGR